MVRLIKCSTTSKKIRPGNLGCFGYAMNMKTLLLSAFVCIGGCSVSNNTRIAGPEGPRPNEKTWVTPKDVPTIDLTEDNVPDFWTATPTIIDTNTFANRHQITGPIPGKHPRPSKFLPAHKKPHSIVYPSVSKGTQARIRTHQHLRTRM